MKLILALFLIYIFVSSSSVAAFAMHSGDTWHSNCIAEAINGVSCPKGTFWDYVLFSLNALQRLLTFIVNESLNISIVFIAFVVVLNFKDLFLKFLYFDFSKIFIYGRYLFCQNNSLQKKFYNWLSFYQKQEDTLSF